VQQLPAGAVREAPPLRWGEEEGAHCLQGRRPVGLIGRLWIRLARAPGAVAGDFPLGVPRHPEPPGAAPRGPQTFRKPPRPP
jgi:hypothetical protein